MIVGITVAGNGVRLRHLMSEIFVLNSKGPKIDLTDTRLHNLLIEAPRGKLRGIFLMEEKGCLVELLAGVCPKTGNFFQDQGGH